MTWTSSEAAKGSWTPIANLSKLECPGHLREHSSSLFQSLEEASAFFEAGSLGYSATPDPTRFQGLQLHCFNWRVAPLEVEEVRSSFFEDEALFPSGSIEFDSALLMRGIEHEWLGKSDLCCAAGAEAIQSLQPSGSEG
jgi:hypothetical protein